MRTVRNGHLLLTRGPVSVHLLSTAQEGKEAVALLDEAESHVQAPLVDEAERERLDGLAAGEAPEAPHWHPILALRNGRPVGYAGVVLPEGGTGERTANADLALDRAREGCGDAVSGLLDGLRDLALRHRAKDLVVWVRHAGPDDVECASAAGFGVERRLLVLGRVLSDQRGDRGDQFGEVRLPEGVRLRDYRPGPDDDALLGVLNAAFDGTVDGNWDHDRLAHRRSFDWFDPADVLLAETPEGDVAGVHWTKRRSQHLGEVYVLAVAPRFQGTGLGRALLRAGLRHLHGRGMREVLLWVDEVNEAAIGLYRSEDFSPRWTDVALESTIG